MNRRDPRIRQTIDRISSGIESASISVQASLFAFSEAYVQPCLGKTSSCLESSCYPCWGAYRDRARARQRHLSRGARPELNFDFYNAAWDDEDEFDNDVGGGERAGLLGGWGADELDRLLAGSSNGRGHNTEQPGRGGTHMNYGSRGGTAVGAKGGEVDPTILPGSSMFGFLERLPWKIGGRALRYKPSAADLQEHPGRMKGHNEATASFMSSTADEGNNHGEDQGLLEGNEDDDDDARDYFNERNDSTSTGPSNDPLSRSLQHRRQRSDTGASRSTANSLSSRGDLLPSSDEDDAIPLDDEFTVALERRNTEQESLGGVSGDGKSGRSSGKGSGSGGKRSKRSSYQGKRRRSGGGTGASKDSEGQEEASRGDKERTSQSQHPESSAAIVLGEELDDDAGDGLPSLEALQKEEERVRAEEEDEIKRKRAEARVVAIERGLVDAKGSEGSTQTSAQSRSDLVDKGSAEIPAEGGEAEDDKQSSADQQQKQDEGSVPVP